MQTKREPRFEIDASVVYQLGEKLISDEVQALVELVKNSYDADADYTHITIETRKPVGDLSSAYESNHGYIIVEDNGTGMDWADIRRGWLTISDSPKRQMRSQGETTPRGRTPLGEKGLGRLGSQRLGQTIEVWTSKLGGEVEHYVGINWGDFGQNTLSQVPVRYNATTSGFKGTRIVISGLKSPEKWEGNSRQVLVNKLYQLLFPFEDLRPFDVLLTINGTRQNLDSISKSVLEVADARFLISYDGETFRLEGSYRPQFLLSPGRQAQSQFRELIQEDRAADFYAYYRERFPGAIQNVKWEDSPPWFVSFIDHFAIENLGSVELVQNLPVEATGTIANPGPFEGVVYSFTRRGLDLESLEDVFNTESEFSKYIERHAGIRVFRDGFGIRPFGLEGNDWLQLGSGWTSAPSYYGLRPRNVIGYIALTAKANKHLEEATDREGFVENGYSRNFYELVRHAVRRINLVNESLRRGYVDYAKYKAEQHLSPITVADMPDTFQQMRDASAASKQLQDQVNRVEGQIVSIQSQVRTFTQAADSAPLFHTEAERKVAPMLKEVEETLQEATRVLKQVATMLPKAEQLGKLADILEHDVDHLRGELAMFSELAGLGMTAEALSHEMKITADALADRTYNLLRKLKRRKSSDPEIVTYTEHVYSAVGRMRKQISHLDPSLRYVREQRDEIDIFTFLTDTKEFYQERFSRNALEIELSKPLESFTIHMNRGKLTQVTDNLILNSEYWLREGLRKGEISAGRLCLRARVPFVEIYDTGRGVAPSVEHLLFHPFVTTKPEGEGRGLGLFIARQLLDSSGCLISLLPDRNEYNRRYIFRIDLTGALADE